MKDITKLLVRLNILSLTLFLIALLLSLFYLYNFYPSTNSNFQASGYGSIREMPFYKLKNLNSSLVQFFPGMRFQKSNISYFIDEDCRDEKKEKIKVAFEIISSQTKIINFYQRIEDPEILVKCSNEKIQTEKTLVAGEGGPSRILNNTLYPVILEAKILLYNSSSCKYPVTEIHELLHVFGFDHVNYLKNIMYPVMDCRKTLDEDIVSMLKDIYSIESLPDLYIEDYDMAIYSEYLNISIHIGNQGLENSENSSLFIYADTKKIQDFSLGEIGYGEGKIFSLKNANLPDSETQKILIVISSTEKELDAENNIIEVKIE